MEDKWIEQLNKGNCLSEFELKKLCEKIKEILLEENNVQFISSPVIICGDIHGQYYDLKELFRKGGNIPNLHEFLLIQLSQVEYLIDIQVLSSFCVDRKKKQERTANTLHRRTNGLSGVWLRNSRLRRSDSPRPRRHRKSSFVTDGSRYRSPG